ncbi:MAG: glycosyltransferase family 39 protein, partial [Frankia sp.]|nr:glycosyltransferase family 39 protein [Frankia sp.]
RTLRRLWRGPEGDPRWARPALLALLAGTALLYLWGLGASEWANAYYSAAAQAGSQSWLALFYGASDAGGSITVDKPPAALWLMGLSARIFGVSPWSILVPEALCGVAAVGLLYAAVRRVSGPAAALLAGVVLALTPVAVLMFRFNNPDALLVALLVGAAYATVRAVEAASARWLALAGVLIGLGFLTKMLQALLIVPVLALVYLIAAPTGLRRRIRDMLLAGLALVASAGWYIAVVELVPESARPYIGGSQNNSILELTFGYNGFGRLTGDETGSVGGGRNMGGNGWDRLFNAEIGGQVAWLLPAALALLVAGLWLTLRAPRTDRVRAALLLWGGWLLVTGAVFSLMRGIFHPYYTVALAPAIGALVGMGALLLWERRQHPAAAVTLAAVTAGSALWCAELLGRTPGWNDWLPETVLVAGLGAAVLLLGLPRLPRVAGLAVSGTAVGAVLLGPGSYALATADTPHSGAIPSAGPSGWFGGRPGLGGLPGAPGGGQGGPGGGQSPLNGGPTLWINGVPFAGCSDGYGYEATADGGTDGDRDRGSQDGPLSAGPGQRLRDGWGGGRSGDPAGSPGYGSPQGLAAVDCSPSDGWADGGGAGGRPGPFLYQMPGGPGGRAGGLLGAATPGDNLVALLRADADDYTWVAATVGANNAAGYQLATGEPVMPVGGFNGTDPSPTLAQFQEYVAEG